jgi:hypothetical protein
MGFRSSSVVGLMAEVLVVEGDFVVAVAVAAGAGAAESG